MTITQVSQKYGLSQDTLRYYERIGIIPPVPRNKSGIRDYDEVSCSWIELMKCMRSSGVQIEALIEYVSLFQQGDATLDARKALLIDQRDQLLERMEQMQQSLDRLNQKIQNYEQVMAAAETKLKRTEESLVRGLKSLLPKKAHKKSGEISSLFLCSRLHRWRATFAPIRGMGEGGFALRPLLFWEPALEQNGRNKGYSDRRQTNSATSQKQFIHIIHQINDGLCRLCAGFVPSLFQQKWLN